MKVLCVTRGTTGGAELASATFIEHRPPGIDVEALLIPSGPLAPRLEALGVPVADTREFGERPGPADLARYTKRMVGFLRRTRPDVVWAVGQKAAFLSVTACRLTGTPLAWHKVDFSWDHLLTKPIAAMSTGVVSVSHAAAEALGPLKARRLVGTVPPPVGLPDDLRAPLDGPPTIGTVARLVPYKGCHHILRAAALLSPEFPDLRVVIAGGPELNNYPDYPAELESLAAELDLTERTDFTGFVSDVPSVLKRLHVFITATYRDEEGYGFEALSGAMLEASWAGIPLVAAEGGGTAEGVVDGETGTLVPSPDPELLAEAIRPYLRDHDLALRTGAAGARFARENCAPEKGAKRLFELIAEIAA